MASIINRGPHQWFVRVRKPRQAKAFCKTFETKLEAEKWARLIESEMDSGTFIDRKEAENTTLFAAFERFCSEYVPQRYAHPKKEEARIRQIQQRPIAAKFLAAIRGRDISDLIREREAEGAGPNSIRLDLASISRLFNVCARDWGMESLAGRNPVQHITSKPKLPPGRERRLTGEEEAQLLLAASRDLRPIIKFAIETALRRSEIISLTWNSVDIQRRTALIRFGKDPKTPKSRSVPLSGKAIAVLQELGVKEEGPIFGFSDAHALTHAFERACRKAGILNLTFHDLRHEAVSRLFERTDLELIHK
jgi:integrase